MILVDTSVWIDFFRDNQTPQVYILKALLQDGESICTCGIVLTEVLQGIRDDRMYSKTQRYFESLIYLPENRSVFMGLPPNLWVNNT